MKAFCKENISTNEPNSGESAALISIFDVLENYVLIELPYSKEATRFLCIKKK